MGGACCKGAVLELNPDGSPKEAQDKEQMKNDPKDLRTAAKQADWAQMRTLLRRMPSAQVNSRVTKDENPEEEGYTALHYSVSINHLKGVQKLVRYTASVHAKTATGKTPLHMALEAGRLQVASFLLSKGADINAKDATGASPVLNVIASGRRKLVRWIIDECSKYDGQLIDWYQQDITGSNAVLYAAKYGFHDFLKDWVPLASGDKLNMQNSCGETVLGWVLKFGASKLLNTADTLELARLLVNAGATVGVQSFPEKVPPICLAAATDDLELLQLMLDSPGAKPLPTQWDLLGRTALHYAAAQGAKATAEKMISMGLQAYTPDKQKNTPLHLLSSSGTDAAAQLLLEIVERCDDKAAALLTPNMEGLTVYHLALKAGSSESAQNLSLTLIDKLKSMGDRHKTDVSIKQGIILDTPLHLAIKGHQDKVVKKLLELDAEAVNKTNNKGELPLSCNLASLTALTYDADAAIFDALINANCKIDSDSPDDHPLLAICKNNLSNFTQRAVSVLEQKSNSKLEWNRKDSKGYTPLMLASFHNNAWLVRHLIEQEGMNPNDESQRTRPGAPQVIGHTGGCCKKAIMAPGTVGNQTPLMCAAKGASVAALKILVQRGADVHAVDTDGRTALAYAMTLDTADTFECARVLLAAGAKTRMPGANGGAPVEMFDITGESWVHRAVRHGAAWFIELWARHQGCLEVLASTPEDCDLMPDGSLPPERKKDIMDSVPTLPEAEDEEADQLTKGDGDDDNDSEAEKDENEDENENESGPVAEGVAYHAFGLGAQETFAGEPVQKFYQGPTPKQLRRWRRQANSWWPGFWVDKENDLPPAELEPDLGLEDMYNRCDVGEDEVDYEDVLDVIMDQEARIAQSVLPRGGALRAVRTRKDNIEFEGGAGGDKLSLEDSRQPDSPARDTALSSLARNLLQKSMRANSDSSSARGLRSAGKPVAEGVLSPTGASLGRTMLASGSASMELDGVSSPQRRITVSPSDMQAATSALETQVNLLAYKAARQMGLSDDIMLAYGLDVPALEESELQLGSLTGQPVAEAKNTVHPEPPVKQVVIKSSAGGLFGGTPGEKFWASEPYYQPETRYQGLPKYMDEATWAWWPKVDCADQMPEGKDCYASWVRSKMNSDSSVTKSKWCLNDPSGPWNVSARLAGYKAKPEKKLSAAALRARNIKWYLNSMSPQEFPLKSGQWMSVQKKLPRAVETARNLAPRAPGAKAQIRKKTVWFGIPDLPFRPELFETSPLVLAVRLGRISCIKALLKLSSSLNIPDGFGLPPLHYAMLMLFKDKTNPDVQHIVDLLLEKRPLVSARDIVNVYLYPRAKAALESLKPGTHKSVVKMATMRMTMYEPGNYDPADYPTIMEPVLLAVLANDLSRLAWLVFCCGANLNEPVVAMQQIPIYLSGLFERECGATQSKVNALHVAILHKNHNTVRQLLDMGADPNTFGREYTGNLKKDLKKKNKLVAEKMAQVQEMSKEAGSMNPMSRVWRTPTVGLFKMLGMMKAFVCSIELPGVTKPHPWVSALHLSCRLGLAPITFLLLKRGAASNGSGAAAYAPKSPLEEALAYARNNAQCYNVTTLKTGAGSRPNYNDVIKQAHLEEDDGDALERQLENLESYKSKLMKEAGKVAAKKPKTTQKDVYDQAMKKAGLSPSTLGLFGREDLKGVAIPDMNMTAKLAAAAKAASDALQAFTDPTKMAMKALAFAAKMVVKMILEMIKRPICHWDPALATAHVMLYHRAPYNANHKQTSIVLRDMVDNATYAWLALDEGLIADSTWKPTAVNKILALKTNDEFGYKQLDMVTDPKAYKKARNKFNSAVDSAYYNSAVSQLGCAYNLPKLVEHLEGRGADGKPSPVKSLSHLRDSVQGMMSKSLMNEMQLLQEKVLDLSLNPKLSADMDVLASKFPGFTPTELQSMMGWGKLESAKLSRLEAGIKLTRGAARGKGWSNAAEVARLLPDVGTDELQMIKAQCQGQKTARGALMSSWSTDVDSLDSAFQPAALKSAKSKLPGWYLELQSHASVQACIDDVASRFSGFNALNQQVQDCDGLPQVNDKGKSMNPFEVLLENGMEWKKPDFPEKAMAELSRTTASLGMADVVKAVQSSYIQVEAGKLRLEQAMRADLLFSMTDAAAKARVAAAKEMIESRKSMIEEQAKKLQNLELMDWSDEDVIDAAMNQVNFDIAISKLGPRGKMAANMLRGSVTPEQLEGILEGGVDEAAKVIKNKLEGMLPEGMNLDTCDMDSLKAAAENVDFEDLSAIDLGEELEAVASDVMKKTALGKTAKRMQVMNEKFSNHPLLGKLYKDMKAQLEEQANEILADLPDLSDPSAKLPDFIGDLSLHSFDDLESKLDDLGDSMMSALEQANLDVLQETVLGLELDFSIDIEAIVEAVSQARDALVSILDILDMSI